MKMQSYQGGLTTAAVATADQQSLDDRVYRPSKGGSQKEQGVAIMVEDVGHHRDEDENEADADYDFFYSSRKAADKQLPDTGLANPVSSSAVQLLQ